MPEFRKLIMALAVVALFAGFASAQVGIPNGAPSSGLPFTCGVTNGAVTPTLRSEGYTELAGDIVIVCSGGTPIALGSPIPTANVTLFVNTTVTSRLLPNAGASNASEALLLVNEPGSGLAGYGPSVAQTPCTVNGVLAPQIGAGLGGCSESIGTVNGVVGVPVNAAGGVGANVFQGVTIGNQVTFNGIPVLPPATSGETTVYRITNVRVNANAIVAGGATPGSVTASVSTNGSTSLAITNAQLTVGFVEEGLSNGSSTQTQPGSLLRNSGNTGSASGGGTSFAQCSSVSVGSPSSATTSASAALGVLQFQENFATAFKIRTQTSQGSPGTIYNSESGLIVPLVNSTATSSTGAQYIAGLADFGTRLKATFNNVPSGVTLYVSTNDVTNDFSNGFAPGYSARQAVLIVGETAPDGGTTIPLSVPAVTPNSVQTQTFGPTFGSAGSVPIAPVIINAATGTGAAVWEVINTNPNQIDTIDFGFYIAYSANAAANSPAPGTVTVTLSFAPTPSGGSFTSTTGAASSASLPIPRFSDSLDITKNVAVINLCTTSMLFPYLTNTNGFDTGLAIANTTSDIFGTAAQAGTCALTFFGPSAPTTNPFVTPVVATGTDWVGLVSVIAPGFGTVASGSPAIGGYMIANCNFQYAHGFALITDVGARSIVTAYLALIFTNGSSLNRAGSSAENLNN